MSNAIRVFPQHKKLVLPARGDISRLVPAARTFEHNGRQLMALPHQPETVRLLYNLGLKAPEPIRYYYD